MEFKGTKGEWEIRPTGALNENEKPLFYDIAVNGSSFISTHKNDYILEMNDDQQLANAKLIAAAPEMLEMLDKFLSEFEHDNATEYECELFYQAKKLIKKATL